MELRNTVSSTVKLGTGVGLAIVGIGELVGREVAVGVMQAKTVNTKIGIRNHKEMCCRIGVLPRSGRLWKHLYKKRMSIERVFRSLKHSRGLEKHCARGMKKILLQATMSVLTFQGTALARLRAGDREHLRQMAVKAG